MELTHSKIDDLFSSFIGQGAIGLAVSGGGGQYGADASLCRVA